MKGIILAAGSGARLSRYHVALPKVLIPVAGRPIIGYTLDAFHQAGVKDVAIVIGYRGDVLKDWIGDGSQYGLNVEYIFNKDYPLGNATSVYAARSFAKGEPFLLSMADHMISSDLVGRLVSFQGSVNALAVDYTRSTRHIEEGTRVLVTDDGLIAMIGKDLLRWNGIDAGAFRLTSDIFDAIGDELTKSRAQHELSQAVTRMIHLGNPLLACDITGSFWHDIDTWEDLEYIRNMLDGGGQ